MNPSAAEDDVRRMLQQLLMDRFHLASHRETKEVQGYLLLTGKNGPKIKPSAAGESNPMPDYLAGKSPAAFEGRIFVSMEGRGASAITGRGVTTAQLAETLSATLGTAVVDRTGMTGNFYFGFRFLSVNTSPAEDADAPSLFSALQDELGLRLEKQRMSVEMRVIDRFQAPSEN